MDHEAVTAGLCRHARLGVTPEPTAEGVDDIGPDAKMGGVQERHGRLRG